uniref:Uncharacterized protein n=1 Tax=Globodera pallida TaxID=36090 RepID=A0A183BUB0_GLOPA
MERGRLNFLFRQLEREVGGRPHMQHPYLEFRRGGGRRRNEPYNGFEHGRGSYSRASHSVEDNAAGTDQNIALD